MPHHIRRTRHAVAATALATGLLAQSMWATPSSAAPVECSGSPVQVTTTCQDSVWRPVVDTETDETLPIPHRRIVGHFDQTNVQFTIYLPPAKAFEGRFFQFTYPTAFTPEEDTSKATDRAISFALTSGGYAVQAGNASVSTGYRHTAAAAKFAEQYAARHYGWTKPIFGYLYGPSGGSFQTTGAAENTHGIWDGFVPLVQGVPMSGPYTFMIREQARLILSDKAQQIADAVRPGGTGDPFRELNAAETAMLQELISFGVPLRGFENPDYLLGTAPVGKPEGMSAMLRQKDPTYVVDFWTKPGYLGTEQSPLGDAVRDALAQTGDTEDHRWDIALRSYYRHQLPPTEQGWTGFDQFRDAQGSPRYPQRSPIWGPLIFGGVSGGAGYTGKITGKMMVLDNLYDVDAPALHADWYARRVHTSLGDAAFAQNYRLYYNDHADHLDAPVSGYRATYLVNWYGIVEQALRDMAAWVEDGVEPPASTSHEVINGQVEVPHNAADRRGLQPTVDLAVRDQDAVTIKAGHQLVLRATAQAAPRAGAITQFAWDFDGDGRYDLTDTASGMQATAKVKHRFDKPGTYYVAVRVTSQRSNEQTGHALVQNIDRVRIIVR